MVRSRATNSPLRLCGGPGLAVLAHGHGPGCLGLGVGSDLNLDLEGSTARLTSEVSLGPRPRRRAAVPVHRHARAPCCRDGQAIVSPGQVRSVGPPNRARGSSYPSSLEGCGRLPASRDCQVWLATGAGTYASGKKLYPGTNGWISRRRRTKRCLRVGPRSLSAFAETSQHETN
jgi:hypothetical protein